MGTPDALRWVLVALMLAVSGYHLARFAAGRRRRTVDVDLTHAAMGLVMAAMLAGRLAPGDAGRLAPVFAVPTVWFAGLAVHGYVMSGPRAAALPLGRAVGGGAMAYMLAVAATARPMPGMAMPVGSPVLATLLATALVGASLPALSRPSVGAGCQVAMTATAAYMLVAL